jgi:hypothetical protein
MVMRILCCQLKKNGGYVFAANRAKLGFACYLLLAGVLLGYSSTLKIESMRSSETSVDF